MAPKFAQSEIGPDTRFCPFFSDFLIIFWQQNTSYESYERNVIVISGGGGGLTSICHETGMCHYSGYFLGWSWIFGYLSGYLFGLFPDFWVLFFCEICFYLE